MLHVTSGDARIAYTVEGCGPTVVLLHGSASSSGQWDGIRAALGGRWATAAVDLLGYGDSDPWLGRRPFALDDEVAIVARVLGRIAGPIHLVGHSYGGAVALKLALTHSDRLASLTLIEPVSFHLLHDGAAVDRDLLREIRAVAEGVAAGTCAGFVDYWNGPGTWAGFSAERRTALCRLAGTIALNFEATLNDPLRLDGCASLRLPTLLLSGERTTRPARRIAALLAATLPRIVSRVVEGAGHMLPRTHPETTIQAIATHIALGTGAEATARRLSAA